ncbi:Ubiquitin carboxyl-terminal hydrolase family protein [Hibiscus syriacus]|uniref:Ubiquitin carboxyl-terminal hydrolase family protein n=1 Tax=Hibiscus syriacus TaxID=106335 RepID=A0A6A3BQG1_HIBSY|nr:Ubiquitin carboxyl-terminal hydrolase family protein [Hibiscus syriacus]
MGEVGVRNPTAQQSRADLAGILRLAARAFDAAQYCLRGSDGVKFNFPDNPPDIAGERSLSPPEIQAFASSFANKSSFDNNNNAGMKTEQYTSSPSVSVSVSVSDQGRAGIQVAESNETVEDWSSFLSMLDTNQGMSDYGFFPGLGDQFYPPPVYDNVDDDLDGDGDGDDFPQHSLFLWNF